MKKVYENPLFEFESYELDEFVASCANTTPNQSISSCVVTNYGGMGNLFTDSNSSCDIKDSEFGSQDNDGYCYHIPIPGHQYFGS